MGRVFTLEEARELLPRVKAVTRPAYELATSLSEELFHLEEGRDAARADELRERLLVLAESWAAAVRELRPEVAGLWRVDFDTEASGWTWVWPGEGLEPRAEEATVSCRAERRA